MRAIWSVRPKCSHRCVSLTETSLKPVQTLKHTTKSSAEQTAMRTKWFKHIAIKTVQAHLLIKDTVKVSLQEYLFTGSSKATSCGFWQKRVRLWDLLAGGLAVLQEPTLTVLLVLPSSHKHRPALSNGVAAYGWPFSRVRKYFSEAEFSRKIPEIPQKALTAVIVL